VFRFEARFVSNTAHGNARDSGTKDKHREDNVRLGLSQWVDQRTFVQVVMASRGQLWRDSTCLLGEVIEKHNPTHAQNAGDEVIEGVTGHSLQRVSAATIPATIHNPIKNYTS